MRRTSVCICALVRDCAPALERNLPWLDTLCTQFRSAQVVIFENDSRDGSKEMLTSWAAGLRTTMYWPGMTFAEGALPTSADRRASRSGAVGVRAS